MNRISWLALLLGATLAIAAVPAFAGVPTQPTSVPEPSTIVLLLSTIGGIGGISAWRRMNKN